MQAKRHICTVPSVLDERDIYEGKLTSNQHGPEAKSRVFVSDRFGQRTEYREQFSRNRVGTSCDMWCLPPKKTRNGALLMNQSNGTCTRSDLRGLLRPATQFVDDDKLRR